MSWDDPIKKRDAPAGRVWRDNEEMVEEWTEYLKTGKARNVVAHYPTDVRVFTRRWGSTLVTTLGREDIMAFVDAISPKCSNLMAKSQPQCLAGKDIRHCPLLKGLPQQEWASCSGYRPLDPTGVLSYLRSVQSFYRWLLEEGYVKYNPVDPVMSRFLSQHKGFLQDRKRNPRRRIVKVDEVRQLVQGSPIHHGIIVALMAKCFLRLHEAMKLVVDPRYFSLDEGWIDIPRNVDYGNKRQGNHRIIMDAELQRLMRDYLAWRERKVKRDAEGSPKTNMLILTSFGLPWCSNGFQGNFKNMMHKDCTRLGLMTGAETTREERINPHCYRAFATTWARDHGASDADLQVLRGDLAPGSIGRYDDHIPRLPGLYRAFAPVLGLDS